MSWYREDRNHPYDRRRPNHQGWDNRYNPRDTRHYDNYGATNAHGFSRRQTPDYSQTRRGYDTGEYRQRGAGYRQDSRDYDHRDRMYDQRDQGYGRNDRSYVPSPRQSPSDRDSFRDRGVRVDRRYSPSDKGYSPREPGYSSQRERRPDSGSERHRRLPDESRTRSSRHEVPETSHKTTTVTQTKGRYNRESGQSHKESRHSSTVHGGQESDDFIVIEDDDVDERRLQDYAPEPNVKEESQSGGPGENLSFDEHLKQLSFVNVLAQTMNRNPGINESTGSVISNSNSEEPSNQNATPSDFVPSVPQTPSDSNPVFQNVTPSGAESHPDNETVQVGTANVAAVDIGPPDHAPVSLSPSVDDKSKQLRKVEGNINDLLSKIQTKIVSERKASKVKSDKATKKDKSPGSNLSKATLPGFEDWNDKDSDLDRSIIDLVSADEDEDFRIGKYKSGSNREGLQTAQETPYNNEDLLDNADFEDVDYRRDIHSDEYHINDDSKTTPGSERDFQSKGNQNDDVEQKGKDSSDTTKQASMTQEELMIEFQRRWDQERKVKEGKQSTSTGKSGASDHEEAEKRIMEQVQQEFKKRWDNEQRDVNETVVLNEDEGVIGEQELNTPRQTINPDEKEQNVKYQDRNKQRQWQRQQEGNRNWNDTRSPAQFNRQDSGDLRNARGSFNNRGGVHNDRGGFQNRGSFNNDRRGFHNKRGGFHYERGGFHNEGGINSHGAFHNDRGNRNFNAGFQNKYDRQDDSSTTARPFQNQFNRQGSGGFHSNSGNQQIGNKFNKSNYGKNLDKNASSSQSKDKSKGINERTEKQSCKDNKESDDSHKTPRKSIKEFKIPKLGKKKEDSKKGQKEESQKVQTTKEATVKTSPTDSILKTTPKELKDKDSKIRVKEKLVCYKIKDQTVSDVKSESLPTSSAGSKEPTTNIFEKLTLEITPPKKVKNSALNEQSGVEKSLTKEQSGEKSVVSIKKDTKPSGDRKDGQKQHDKVLKHVEKVKEQSSASIGSKEKKFAEKKLAEKELADKKKKSIEIIEEETNSSSDSNSSGIFGKMELYIGKGKASSKEDVKSSEKQSKSDKKDRKEEKRVKDSKNKNHFGIRGIKRINGQLYWKTFKLLQPKIVLKNLTPREIAKKSKRKSSSDIKDKNTKKKSSKGFSMVKDTNKTLKILSEREDFSPVKEKKKTKREDFPPVKEKKKTVCIVSESESDLSPVQAKKKVAPILSESEDLSPIKAKKKSTHILSDSEENQPKEERKNDEELSNDFSPIQPKKKHADVLSEREDLSSVKQKPTEAVVQSESENEDSEALMDEIKDGEHMEIGSDGETQEFGQCSEQEEEDMGDTFEDDIGSAIAESLESAELLDPDLDTVKEVEMECSATGHCDKRSQESNQSSLNQSKKESPREEKEEKGTSSYASNDAKMKNKKPVCTVTVTVEDEEEEEEEEEQSQSLFQDEPKSKMVGQLMSVSSDESEKEKSAEDMELVDISKKANPADHRTKTVSKDDSSGDDLPEIRTPKLTPRTRVVSRKSLEGKDSHEENKSTDSQITPRKRKLFKHNKIVTPKVEESGNDGDVEDNDVVFDEPTQAYEETANFDEPTQTFDEPTQNYDEQTPNYDKGDKVSDNDNQKDDDGLDSPPNDKDVKSDEIDGDKLQVKDEPDWLKNGYTQEPDTVFISEDEDDLMVMSISQPIICLDTSDSDSDDVKDRKKVTKVSSKKITVKKEMNLDGEGVNDPEYWEISSPDNDSDRGSDFEADDFFRMISRLSETTQQDSEEEKEESLNELDMSIFSDEDDNLLEETQKQSTDLNDAKDSTENELIKSKPKQKFRRESGDVAAEQSSKDDKDMIHSQQSQIHPPKSGKKAERQTTTEHSDGVEIIIEDMDDDESLDSSWSDDSYMSDLDVQQMMEQATQKVADTEEQTKGKDSATDKVQKQEIETSTDTEKGNKDDSNLNKKQYESETQSFDSEKTIQYSADTQIDEEGSVTSEDETQVMADDDYYMQATQVDREDSHETSDQQAETQVVDTDMDDHYTAETQIDETQSESDEEGQIADYTAKTQTMNDPSTSAFEAETQVDDVNTNDLYGAETQVDNQNDDQYQAQTQIVQDSIESDDSDGAENMYNDPQYEMYIQKGNNETPVRTNNNLGIKLDHSFCEDNTSKEKKNKDKESTDPYTVETQPISPVEKDIHSDNENDPYMEQTQVDKDQMDLPEVESISDDDNDVYMGETQIDGKQVESPKSDSEDDVYMEPTQIDRNQLQSSESEDENDAYMAETQVDADAMDLPDLETFSDNDRDVYMEQTQIDTEPVAHTTDPADAYCDLTQDDDAERYKQDYDSNRNKKIQETTQRNEIKSGSFKTSLETITKESFKKGMLSLKKGLQKLVHGKRSYSFDTDSQRKLIELPKSDAPDDVGVSSAKKSRMDNHGNHRTDPITHGKAQSRENSTLSNDGQRKSIMIEPLPSTSFYKPPSDKYPPARSQSFLDANKGIIVSDATKDDTWLSKKSSKDKGKGKSGKRRRNKSSDSAADMTALISKARQGCEERRMKFKSNPDCIADPAKKLKHQISSRSLDEEQDVELPSLSQVIDKGYPILDQSMLMKSKQNKEPTSSSIDVHVTTSTSTIVTSTVSMATSTSTATTGSTVHASIPSTSASTPNTTISVSRVDCSQSSESSLKSKYKSSDKHSGVSRSDSRERDHNTSSSKHSIAHKYVDGTQSHTGDKHHEHSGDKYKTKSGHEHSSVSDKHSTDKHLGDKHASKSKDQDKFHDKHSSGSKDKYKTGGKKKSSDKHGSSSDHKVSSKHRHSSGSKHTSKEKHKQPSSDKLSSSDTSLTNVRLSTSDQLPSDKVLISDKPSISDKPPTNDKPSSSGENHLYPDKANQDKSFDKHKDKSDKHKDKPSDKHKDKPSDKHKDRSSDKHEIKDGHKSSKHKHKSGHKHKHDKDGDRKHHKSKDHESERSGGNKSSDQGHGDKRKSSGDSQNSVDKDSSAIHKHSDNKKGSKSPDNLESNSNKDTSKTVSVVSGSKENSPTYEKESGNSVKPVSEDNQHSIDKEVDVLSKVVISVTGKSSPGEDNDKHEKGKKDKDRGKISKYLSSPRMDENQVPSTSKDSDSVSKMTSGSVLMKKKIPSENKEKTTPGIGLQSCLTGKSATAVADQKKKQRTVTWGRNTVHGIQGQGQMGAQNKVRILSTSAESLMQKITIGAPPPIVQPVTYPPDLMKINDRVTWERIIVLILKWNPVWFEERDKMELSGVKKCLPPPVNEDISPSGLFQLVDKYISLEEYVNKFMLPLLMLETWQTMYTDWREKKNRGKLHKLYLLLNQQCNFSERLQEFLFIGVMTREEKKHWATSLNDGELITLRIHGQEKQPNGQAVAITKYILAIVVSVTYKESRKDVDRICEHAELGKLRKPDSIGVMLAVRVRKRLFTPYGLPLTEIQSVSSLVSTKRQVDALAYFPRSPLCRDLLFPSSSQTYSDRAVASLPHDRKKLNQSQSVAVNTVVKVASRVATGIPRICLLQGPPGTGKSFTIINIIRRIVQEKKGQCSICLTAPSHAAVDELLRKIHKQNIDPAEKTKVNLVRLGKKHSVHSDVQCYCLDSLVQRRLLDHIPQSLLAERNTLDKKIAAIKENLKSTKDEFKGKKWSTDLRKLQKDKENLEAQFLTDRVNPGQEKRAKSEILNGAHVIAGTLSSMGSNLLKTFLSQKNTFDCVIVDEATQAIEVETLIPLQFGVSKLVLVGDPEQLCPTVLSQHAQDHKLNMSLFQRLDSHFRYSTDSPNPIIFLDTQYRMDREIASFPNNYIYEGRLKSETPPSKFNLVPYLLYDMREGEEQFSQGSRSMSNQMEALFTAELCKLILEQTKFVERSIGIIAPYAKQKDEILKQLAIRGMKQIEVSTVDGFQGREKHIVIMSCVRAVSGSLGFVGNRNRMNVALTRAKYAMYLVGHFGALESSDEWKALIADARQRNKIVNVTIDTYKDDTRYCLKGWSGGHMA